MTGQDDNPAFWAPSSQEMESPANPGLFILVKLKMVGHVQEESEITRIQFINEFI